MERDCYRCGQPINDSLAFCSSCGAPQIKVSRAPELPPSDSGSALPDSSRRAPVTAVEVASLGPRIEWRPFLRLALPLALLAGIVTAILPSLGFFVVLPAGTIFAILRYRQRRAHTLRGGQGARMGAATALLSFGFFVAAIVPGWPTLRPLLVTAIQERAAQTPDPQARQMAQWLATPEGAPVLLGAFLGGVLVVFLLVGLSSGALAARLGRSQPRM